MVGNTMDMAHRDLGVRVRRTRKGMMRLVGKPAPSTWRVVPSSLPSLRAAATLHASKAPLRARFIAIARLPEPLESYARRMHVLYL